MTKKIMCLLLALTLILAAVPALADNSSMTLGGLNQVTGQSPTLSMTLNNLNQVSEIVTIPSQSPTLSVTLHNLNQVTGAETTQTQSPTLSMTLNNLNQVAGIVTNPALSPTLSMTLNSLNWLTQIGEYGIPLAGLFTIMETLTNDAQAELDTIAAYVNKGQAAAGYFDINIPQLALNGYLSSDYLGFDLSGLIISEYVSLGINNYQENGADVSATFGFASEYRDGQTVIAMFGYKEKNGKLVWNALNAVAADGRVTISFPSELLLKAGSEAILGILS